MLPAVPFALVEIGASTGLNLFWDKYRYEYECGPGHEPVAAGDLASPVRIGCAIRGAARPPLCPDDPFAERVVRRVGIELEPIDLDNPVDLASLRALVWPEQRKRASRLDQAIAIAQAARSRLNFSMRQGDGVVLLPTIAAELADGEALYVVHSFTLKPVHIGSAAVSRSRFTRHRGEASRTAARSRMGAPQRAGAQPHRIHWLGHWAA